MGEIEDVSPKLRAQQYADELGWDDEFIEYTDEENAYRERVAKLREQTDGPLNKEKRVIDDSAAFTSEIKEKALELGADLVGVSEVEQENVYSNREASEKFAVCIAVHMDYAEIAKAPHSDVSVEVYRIYEEMSKTAVRLAEYIRQQGYPARAQIVGRYDILLVPHAHAAGLGEQCRIGVLSSAEYGPCMRLAAVVTDAPLVTDEPVEFGVADICDSCYICVESCPGGAIPEEKTITRGVEKWTLEPVRCMRYLYYKPDGCTICLKACPLSEVVLPYMI